MDIAAVEAIDAAARHEAVNERVKQAKDFLVRSHHRIAECRNQLNQAKLNHKRYLAQFKAGDFSEVINDAIRRGR